VGVGIDAGQERAEGPGTFGGGGIFQMGFPVILVGAK
jgi:hypothetical protein